MIAQQGVTFLKRAVSETLLYSMLCIKLNHKTLPASIIEEKFWNENQFLVYSLILMIIY